MKFEVGIARDRHLKIVDAAYTFGEFPTIDKFILMPDKYIGNVKMVGFEDRYLRPLEKALKEVTHDFKRPGYYVSVTIDPEHLIDYTQSITISIKLR